MQKISYIHGHSTIVRSQEGLDPRQQDRLLRRVQIEVRGVATFAEEREPEPVCFHTTSHHRRHWVTDVELLPQYASALLRAVCTEHRDDGRELQKHHRKAIWQCGDTPRFAPSERHNKGRAVCLAAELCCRENQSKVDFLHEIQNLVAVLKLGPPHGVVEVCQQRVRDVQRTSILLFQCTTADSGRDGFPNGADAGIGLTTAAGEEIQSSCCVAGMPCTLSKMTSATVRLHRSVGR